MKKPIPFLPELKRLNDSILSRWGTILLIFLIFALTVPAVSADEALSASFTFLPTNPTVGDTVTFSGSATWTNITTWTWDFGDGPPSEIGQTKTHAYKTAGGFTVQLTVSDDTGAIFTASESITVVAAAIPLEASFSWAPTSPAAGQPVTFTDTSMGDVTTWGWAFGDGETSQEQSPSHPYSAAGIYPVTLTVVNADGTSPATQQVSVTSAVATPVASFLYSPIYPKTADTVTFTDTSTGNPTGWSWDFGNGQFNGMQSPPAQTYSSAGKYIVSLTASNADGTSVAYTRSITVGSTNPLVADFDLSTYKPKVDEKVTFTDKSVGDPDEWEWDFGDKTEKYRYQSPPDHSYTKDDEYDVKLTIKKPGGYSDTITKKVTVGKGKTTVTDDKPTASFTWEPSTPVVGSPVDFKDTSTGDGITEWKWDFDDKMDFTGNRESMFRNPQHTYQYPGIYDVTLFVNNSGGIGDIILKKVTVIKVPLNAKFSTSPASGTAPLTVRFVDSSTGTGIESYQWDFGNGQTYIGKSPSNVVYSLPGTYRVSLEITDENGSKNNYAMSITVNPPATAAPPQTAAVIAASTPDAADDGGFIGGEYRMMTGLYNEYIKILFGFLGISDGLDFLIFVVE